MRSSAPLVTLIVFRWPSALLPTHNIAFVALHRMLLRLLRCKSKLRQKCTDRCQTESNAEILLDQFCYHSSCPQAEVKAIVSRIAAIDPAEHLLLLRRRQATRPS